MYLKLRDTGFGRPLYEYHVHERAEMEYLAEISLPGMMVTDIRARVGCYTLLGAEILAIRSTVKESA